MVEGTSLVGRTISHYQILELLGQGGMGVVYRAHDEQLDRDVAVKVLSAGRVTDENARKQFRKEALALAKMNHANIEIVHEFASQDGLEYLVTEYIEGKTLSGMLKSGALPEKEVCTLGAQIAAGLEEAHEHGIVHCDLKPENIQVNLKRQAKVLDFGLAKLLRPTVDATTLGTGEPAGATSGTLPYMAPEQLSGGKADARTDVHALGLVLYEMCTGERAFGASELAPLVDTILHKMPVAPRERNPMVSAELERIIYKALDKEPNRRYQSARELSVDLERLITPTTASIAPWKADTAWQKFRRTSRAHPMRVALSGSIIALALVAIFWFVGTRPVLSFSPRDWILLTDFDNQTGETVFDRSLLTALTIGLEQSAHANIFPRARIPETLKRMSKPANTPIDETVGVEICQRESIRGLLSSRIAKVGQAYLVSAELVDPRTGVSVRSYLERAKGQEEVLTALDKIANRLRRDLGESLSAIQKADWPLPSVTTSSLPALKDYADGSDLWSRGKFQEAAEAFTAAVQLDPDFAMAHAALGNAYYSFIFNDPGQGKIEYEKALQLATRATERERLTMQVGYAANQRHNADAANLYRLYLERYPDDFRMRSNLAGLLREDGDYKESIDQYLQVLRIAPTYAAAYINTATAYDGVGDTDASLKYYELAFKLEPEWRTSTNLNHEYGFTLVRKGEDDEAAKVFELALQKPEMKGTAQRSLGWLDLYHGKYKAARGRFEDAQRYFTAVKAPLSQARTDILLAIVADGQGDRSRALKNLDDAQQFLPDLGPKVWIGSLSGCLYARLGSAQKAEQIEKLIQPAVDSENMEQSSQLHRLQGEIALARGETTKAVENFKLADNERPDAQTSESLARAYRLQGNVDESISWYEKLMGNSQTPLGWEPQQDWLAAHYQLAKAYAAQGKKDKAVPLLEALLTRWKDADVDIPLLQEAKAERAKLP